MLKNRLNNTVLKFFSYNGIVVLGKLIASFIVSKISAIYLGPSGYALVGNFKNILQGVIGITASGFESGVIKYTAQYKEDKKAYNIVIASALSLSIIISLLLGVFLFFFAETISIYILKDIKYAFVFRVLAVFLPLVSLNYLMIYVFNGLQNLKRYSSLIIIGNILNALVVFFLIYFFNLKGALLASVLIPALNFLCGLFFKDVRDVLIIFLLNIKHVSTVFLKSISTYVAMAAYSSILISFTYLSVRNNIISNLDIDNAGLWEAMNKISSFYMLFFTSLITLYLLPKLAINTTVKGYVNIMKSYFSFLIPFLMLFLLGVFFLRVFIVKIFLTSEFKLIESYFYLQLIGDFIKIIAFSLAYQFHAKKMVSFYLITDAVLYFSFYFLGTFLIDSFLLKGVFYAYIVSVLLYLILVFIFIAYNNSNYLKNNVEKF